MAKKSAKGSSAAAKPALLSGGNPQIAKGDGEAPVQAYLAAMPGWKRDVGRSLDALIMSNVPHARKAGRRPGRYRDRRRPGRISEFNFSRRADARAAHL